MSEFIVRLARGGYPLQFNPEIEGKTVYGVATEDEATTFRSVADAEAVALASGINPNRMRIEERSPDSGQRRSPARELPPLPQQRNLF